MPKTETYWTIGHSTRPIETFLALLKTNRIQLLADVRLLPGSKRHPQFNQAELQHSLGEHHIAYAHVRELGGRRRARPDSKNTAWHHSAFRGYADYMEAPEFARGITRLRELASLHGRTALMCAEAVWWRCHRSLIADYLKANGHEVLHILDQNKTQPHPYTSAARLIDGWLSYRAEDTPELLQARPG